MNQHLEIGLHWIAVAFYCLSAILYIYGFVFRKDRAFKWALVAAVCGLIPHTAALGLRWYVTGHGPYLRRYEVLSSNVWVGLVMFILVQRIKPVLRPFGAVVMPVSFLLIGLAVLSSPETHPLPETFQTFWLLVHILFAKLAYGSCLIATALAGGYLLLQGGGRLQQKWAGRLPAPGIIDEFSYRFTGFGFMMIGIMIAAGAIWANDAWGSYWSWDPVETWSLLSWVVYGLYLHLRRMHGWRGRKAAWYTMIAFLLLLFTIFGIGLIYVSEHSPYMN